MTNSTKIPVWFWIIAVIALLWNLSGVFMYLSEAYMSDEVLATLPQEVQNGYANRPAWVTAAFAIAVFAGALGSLALLLRKKWAVPVFLLSLIAVLAQQVYNFFIQKDIAIEGMALIGTLAIVIIAGLLYWFSKGAREKAWLS